MKLMSRLSSVPKIRRPVGSFRLVFISASLGIATGLFVIAIRAFVAVSQGLTLGFVAENSVVFPPGQPLWRIPLALSVGAILVGLIGRWAAKRESTQPIDAVEANALRGGKMTVMDGTAVVLPILTSVAVGASVGTEAAVTQAGAVLASVIGTRLNLPRSDLRLLVGAGAAAAISAAYQAPIAGVFYAFELIIGTYSKRILAPISIASITSVLTVWTILGIQRPFDLYFTTNIMPLDYGYAVALGCLGAFTGVIVMLLVSAFERGLRWLLPNEDLRRVASGLITATLAMWFPSVLGSGHAAIDRVVNGRTSGLSAVELFAGKIVSSSVSLGGGYRGGLFSASLLIGALLGRIFAWFVSAWPGVLNEHANLFALCGMAAVGASIVGSPLAVIFLVLETTGSFESTIVVTIGAVTAAFLTDRLFGYSFATWRFQQRGLAIESGQDVARLTATPITGLIRPPKRFVEAGASLQDVVLANGAAGPRGTAVLGRDGAFLGLIDPALVEVVQDEPELPVVAEELIYVTMPVVTPDSTLAELLDIFRADDRSTIAVLVPGSDTPLVGCVRARDTFALASSVLADQRQEDLGTARWRSRSL